MRKFTLRINKEIYQNMKSRGKWNGKNINRIISNHFDKELNLVSILISKYDEINNSIDFHSCSIEQLEEFKKLIDQDLLALDKMFTSECHEPKFKRTIYLRHNKKYTSQEINNIFNC